MAYLIERSFEDDEEEEDKGKSSKKGKDKEKEKEEPIPPSKLGSELQDLCRIIFSTKYVLDSRPLVDEKVLILAL